VVKETLCAVKMCVKSASVALVFTVLLVIAVSLISHAQVILFEERFERLDPQVWPLAEQFWTVEGGWLVHTTTAEENMTWAGDKEWTDYDLSLRLRMDEFGAEGWSGPRIVVRFSDYDDFVVVLLDKDGGVSLHWRNPETGWDPIASGGHWPLYEGEEYEVLVSVRGNEYEVYIDGEYVIGATDTRDRAPKGAIGIYAARAKFGVTDVVVTAPR